MTNRRSEAKDLLTASLNPAVAASALADLQVAASSAVGVDAADARDDSAGSSGAPNLTDGIEEMAGVVRSFVETKLDAVMDQSMLHSQCSSLPSLNILIRPTR